MSQMVTRKRTGGDEKEKRTDSPVKDMKKKMAANAEKEKNAAESTPSKSEKPVEKPANKPADKPSDKPADKPTEKPTDKTSDKPADKNAEKLKTDKPTDKQKEKAPEKPAEKKAAEKKDGPSDKKKEENGKGESSGKTEKPGKTAKQNGSSNGINGTAHASSDSELLEEGDETELFPELAYDDSDVEWEPGMDSTRSLTRRSQSKESKVLKLSQEPAKDTPKSDKKSDAKTDKKSDAKSDKKSDAKSDVKKSDAKQDSVQETSKADAKKEVKESPKKDDRKEEKSEKVEFEVVVEIENSTDTSEESRKPDTNFSKSRVKVSPYRRSTRLADQTASSVAANYTGNNTTMEMDITESSSFMEASSMDDSYLSGLRSIRGRRSYKPLQEVALRSAAASRSVRSVTSSIVSEQSSRPTAPVVGRKRKPDPEDDASPASEAEELPAAGKRQRLLERLARPFRRSALLPLPARRNAEIVGINTDLPLTAPVASTSSFDPEALKPAPAAPAAPLLAAAPGAEDSKRCAIM